VRRNLQHDEICGIGHCEQGDQCRAAVRRAYSELRSLGRPDQHAFEAAVTIYRQRGRVGLGLGRRPALNGERSPASTPAARIMKPRTGTRIGVATGRASGRSTWTSRFRPPAC
jgi:hypothetical protein